MKKRVSIAATIAAISVFIYPLMEHLADVERGYDSAVFGGEEILLIFGLVIAVLIIVDGLQNMSTTIEKDDCQTTTACSTESEQSVEHITLTR